jgi:hypothetical protein
MTVPGRSQVLVRDAAHQEVMDVADSKEEDMAATPPIISGSLFRPRMTATTLKGQGKYGGRERGQRKREGGCPCP